jgi:hypothetical protein
VWQATYTATLLAVHVRLEPVPPSFSSMAITSGTIKLRRNESTMNFGRSYREARRRSLGRVGEASADAVVASDPTLVNAD